MAHSLRISLTLAEAMANAITATLDAGTAAVIEIYDGSQPALPTTAVTTQVLLATLTMSATSFAAAIDGAPGGKIIANAITADSAADASGTASWFRIKTQTGGTAHIDGSCGTSSSDINWDTVTFVIGANISLSSGALTMPQT